MASSDPPPPADALSAVPLIPKKVPPPIGFPSVRPLILRVSPPPGSPDLEEYYYDPLLAVLQGSFAAVHAFFVVNGHEVTTIDCPNFNAFLVTFPGTIACWIAKLPVLVLLKGGQLLLDQAIAGLTSRAGGFAIQGGAPTVAPRSFLDHAWSSPLDQSLPCCLKWSFCPPVFWLSNLRGAAIMFPLRCITGVCPLALIQSASTLL
jgi:hypothetical protein